MTETKYIQGAGGGGGKGGGGGSRTPTEADDTLQSVQFASVLDLISEGEIAGIEDPGTGTNSWQQNVYLDNTPVKNSNNSDNFSGFSPAGQSSPEVSRSIAHGEWLASFQSLLRPARLLGSTPTRRGHLHTEQVPPRS